MTYPLPSGWQEVKLQECLLEQPKYGMNAPAVKYDNSLPTYIRITDIDEYGNFINDNKVSVNNENYEEYILNDNDFLFARTGASVGKTYLYNKKDGTLVFAGYLIKVKPNQNILNSLFLKYYTQSKRYWDFVKITSTRTGQPGINGKEYANMNIILPPLEEQKRIAEVLSLCDDIIENLTELIEKKEQYKKGVMQRLLSGEVRFKGFTDEWQTVRLGDILSYEQPNNYIVKNDEYNNKYECPVLTAGKTFILGYTNEKFGIYDKIPVIIFDDFTTETKYVNFPFKVKSSAIKILSSNKCNLKLIYELIKMIKFNAESHKRYWISEYQYLEIKIPTSIEEQKKIAGLLSLIDEDIENLKKQLELRKQQKKGLMQRLLTGEVRI